MRYRQRKKNLKRAFLWFQWTDETGQPRWLGLPGEAYWILLWHPKLAGYDPARFLQRKRFLRKLYASLQFPSPRSQQKARRIR